ncbi:unnamed protein product [Closterium sp. NIES-64]|nr:unnamed protein product [Closterium sp. NIES-64]
MYIHSRNIHSCHNRLDDSQLHLVVHETCKLEKLGGRKKDGYGAWMLCTNHLRPGGIVYSFGIGGDVSFDNEMVNRGYKVFGFDPTVTPDHVSSLFKNNHERDQPSAFQFCQVGIGAVDGIITFFSPKNPRLKSMTAVKHEELSKRYESRGMPAPVMRLPTFMCSNGHGFIDVLKIDVEGVEFDICDEWLRMDTPLPVGQVLGRQTAQRDSGWFETVPFQFPFQRVKSVKLVVIMASGVNLTAVTVIAAVSAVLAAGVTALNIPSGVFGLHPKPHVLPFFCTCDDDSALMEDSLARCQVASDFLIALAYLSIPLELAYFTLRARNFSHRWVMLLFSLFIVLCGDSACSVCVQQSPLPSFLPPPFLCPSPFAHRPVPPGLTHLVNVWTYGAHPRQLSVVQTVLKVLCAAVSWGTAFVLFTIIPSLLKFKASAFVRPDVSFWVDSQHLQQLRVVQKVLKVLCAAFPVRELSLQHKAAQLDREMDAIRRREEVGRHVRMLTYEIRQSLDRHTILNTTLVELAQALVLENCTVWMPDPCECYWPLATDPLLLTPVSATPDPLLLTPVSATDPLLLTPVSATDPLLLTPVSATDPLLLTPVSATDPLLLTPVSATTDPLLLTPVSATDPLLLTPVSATDPLLLTPVSATDPLLLTPVSATDPLLLTPVSATDPWKRVHKCMRSHTILSTTPYPSGEYLELTHELERRLVQVPICVHISDPSVQSVIATSNPCLISRSSFIGSASTPRGAHANAMAAVRLAIHMPTHSRASRSSQQGDDGAAAAAAAAAGAAGAVGGGGGGGGNNGADSDGFAGSEAADMEYGSVVEYGLMVLVLHGDEKRQWQPHEVEMVEAVADQVAIALSHAAALEESQVTVADQVGFALSHAAALEQSQVGRNPLLAPSHMLQYWNGRREEMAEQNAAMQMVRQRREEMAEQNAAMQVARVRAEEAIQARNDFLSVMNHERREEMAEQNAALQVARIRAEEAIQARNDFLSVMNHEMRSPLHTILALSSLMEEDDLTDEQGPMVATLTRSASMLTSLISDVIGVAQRQEINLVLEHRPFDLRRMLHDAASLAWPMMRAKGLSFSVVIAREVPRHVVGDERRLLRVVLHIIGHAIDSTHEVKREECRVMPSGAVWCSSREVPQHVVGDERRLLRMVLHIIRHAIDSTDEISHQDHISRQDHVRVRITVTDSGGEESKQALLHRFEEAREREQLLKGQAIEGMKALGQDPSNVGIGLFLSGPEEGWVGCTRLQGGMESQGRLGSQGGMESQGDASAAAAVEVSAALAAIEAPQRSAAEDLREAEAAEAERERQARISEQFVAPSCAICQKLLLLMDGHYWNATQPADPGAATAFSVRLLCDRTRRRHRRRRHMMNSLEGSGDEGSGSEEDGDGEVGSDSDESSCSIGAYIQELEGIRVLLVEDNVANRIATHQLLLSLHCHVTLAASTQECLSILSGSKKSPSASPIADIVLLDICMPDVDGLEAARCIHKMFRRAGIQGS